MKKAMIVALSLATVVLAGNAQAAPGEARMKRDADGNGVITRAEAQSRATAMFARMDANKDGKLDASDRALNREAMKTRRFEQLDTDRNGQISKAEFMADRGPRDGERRGHRGRGMRGGHGGGMMGMGKRMGADGTGSVTQADFVAAALARFDAMDTNKDGQVTQAERQAARAQMKAKWQAERQQRRANATPG